MRPELFGLVLAGGRSTRMGRDKATLVYHREPQWKHVADLLAPHCRRVFWSCRPEQRDLWQLGDRALTDAGTDGPAAGLATAFAFAPHVAWLVAAIDTPALSGQDLTRLVAARDRDSDATAFRAEDGGPEPLLAVWEPAAQARLLGTPSASPRRLLGEGPLRLVTPTRLLTNVNCPGNGPALTVK